MIGPIFEKLSDKYGHANFQFIHVDVDEVGEGSQGQGVRALPTFVFYKNSIATELARIQGADAAGLESKIKELAPRFEKSHFGGEGNKLGGSGGGTLGGGSAKSSSSSSANNALSPDEMIQIAQANVEYSLGSCCRVGVRFQPAVGGLGSSVKPFLRINPTDKISKLRLFIDTLVELSSGSTPTYELHNSYPPGKLDEEKSVGDGGVAGAVVVVKFV